MSFVVSTLLANREENSLDRLLNGNDSDHSDEMQTSTSSSDDAGSDLDGTGFHFRCRGKTEKGKRCGTTTDHDDQLDYDCSHNILKYGYCTRHLTQRRGTTDPRSDDDMLYQSTVEMEFGGRDKPHPPIVKAAMNGDVSKVKEILDAKNGLRKLNARRVRLDFEERAGGYEDDVDVTSVEDDTPLIAAVRNGHVDVVVELLIRGADVSLESLRFEDTHNSSQPKTTIQVAIDKGHTKGGCMLRMLKLAETYHHSLRYTRAKIPFPPARKTGAEFNQNTLQTLLRWYGRLASGFTKEQLLRRLQETDALKDLHYEETARWRKDYMPVLKEHGRLLPQRAKAVDDLIKIAASAGVLTSVPAHLQAEDQGLCRLLTACALEEHDTSAISQSSSLFESLVAPVLVVVPNNEKQVTRTTRTTADAVALGWKNRRQNQQAARSRQPRTRMQVPQIARDLGLHGRSVPSAELAAPACCTRTVEAAKGMSLPQHFCASCACSGTKQDTSLFAQQAQEPSVVDDEACPFATATSSEQVVFFNYGMHKGRTFADIFMNDAAFCRWARFFTDVFGDQKGYRDPNAFENEADRQIAEFCNFCNKARGQAESNVHDTSSTSPEEAAENHGGTISHPTLTSEPASGSVPPRSTAMKSTADITGVPQRLLSESGFQKQEMCQTAPSLTLKRTQKEVATCEGCKRTFKSLRAMHRHQMDAKSSPECCYQ
ncbi:unnamed protein product [Amoebophrya sp. A120]|nr:unnamed protein product [Amoebophrya sp. A120]|eukprot:GSA120T00001515001.1